MHIAHTLVAPVILVFHAARKVIISELIKTKVHIIIIIINLIGSIPLLVLPVVQFHRAALLSLVYLVLRLVLFKNVFNHNI